MSDEPPEAPLPSATGGDRWDIYWAHGFLTSCALAFSANYEGRMRSVWEEFFTQLAPGARILDICTGNGAIAVIANEISRDAGKAFEIHGIDRARIDPAATLTRDRELLAGIHFHGGVPAEHTPFADGYFDAVTGQYALEYTDTAASIRELARILQPGGRCLFVMHHAGSIVLDTGREELRHARLLFEKTALFERARDLLLRMGGAAGRGGPQVLAADADAEGKRERLNRAAAEVTAAIRRSAHPEMLRTALGHLSRAFGALQEAGLEAAVALLADAEREIRANVERLRDLERAASDADRIAAIAAELGRSGLRCATPDALQHETPEGTRHLVGWVIRGRRI